MSSLGQYSFLPWVREGIANKVQTPTAGALRATAEVRFNIRGTGGEDGEILRPVSRDVELYAPGDIIGIESKAIVRNEPRMWITNYEPNFLPYIEFYDEDYPWRYTPSPPDGDRLSPWLVLAILDEDEFEDAANPGGGLQAIKIDDPDSVLPPPAELWAWAHVHVNESITPTSNADPVSAESVASTDATAISAQLASVINKNPDLACARLLSPRKLAPDRAYHGFLLPSFETGRLAGLGLDTSVAPGALFPGWGEAYPAGTRPSGQLFPVYHRWFFKTGPRGDFEELVRILKPRIVDSRVGRRDIDVMQPGSNIPPIDDEELLGVLRLSGALQVPEDTMSDADKIVAERYESWDEPGPHPFQSALASFINLADDYSNEPAADANADSGMGPIVENDPDPLITPPIYGRWHARTQRLLEQPDGTPVPRTGNWVHELNLDPRWRTAAGFGTDVMQRNQEKYMEAAWQQVGDVVSANRRMRFAQFVSQVAMSWYATQLNGATLDRYPGRVLQIVAPLTNRMRASDFTASYVLRHSTVPFTMLNPTFRRVSRPRSSTAKRLGVNSTPPDKDIVTRVSLGEVVPVPEKTDPEDLSTVTEVEDLVAEDHDRRSLRHTLRLIILIIILLLLLIAGLFFGLATPAVVLGGIVVLGGLIASHFATRPPPPVVTSGDPEQPGSAVVSELPKSPDFVYRPLGRGVPATVGGAVDSAESIRFKTAAGDLQDLIRESRIASPKPERRPIDIAAFSAKIVDRINPATTYPLRIAHDIAIPGRLTADLLEIFAPVMAYPVINEAMYEPLADISSDHFVPNLQLIPQNTITLLETNQPFIEAYMVGLNHEFARELLWREYPTDQRGSTFRQFWDVQSVLDVEDTDPEVLREQLRDIPPLHRWPRASQLGDHDHRETGGEAENELVLVIRGELLKRYPNAVIYAQRARWQRDDDDHILRFEERRLVEIEASEAENPPPEKLLMPLYEAKVNPDIYFIGFDLTAEVARGGTGENDTDDPGWFFVIKERPGEPRFGFDVSSAGEGLGAWNDLAWEDVLGGPGDGQFIPTNQNFSLTEVPETDERRDQWEEDRHVSWTPSTNAANLAYILYQVPVMVGVHAGEMLPRE